MTPTIGRVVIFSGEMSNGALEHPAIITRVWGPECVNLTVFLDNAAPRSWTSVMLGTSGIHWRWPERV